jgi:ABC-type Fe3+-hydroxamate transport system substrate-binding protein
MGGNTSRRKGADGERELVKILNGYGIPASRGFVWLKQSDMIGIKGIHPEVKRYKKAVPIFAAMRQAIKEAEKRQDGKPTVFHRVDYGPWLVTSLADGFKCPEGINVAYKELRGLNVATVALEDWIKIYKEGNADG